MTQPTDQQPSSSSPKKGSSFWRALIKYGIPLVITIGLCWLLFTQFDFREMMIIIRRDCNFWWIGGALVVSIFSHIFRAMRWRIQLDALGVKVPLFFVVLSIFGTYAVNLVFPRLGEIWRTGYIAERQHAPFTTVFGSMVADRLADTVTVALLTLFTFMIAGSELMSYLSQNMASYERMLDIVTNPWLWCGLLLAAAAVWAIFYYCPNNKIVSKVREIWDGLWGGFAVIVKMPGRGRWLLLTLAVWGCYFFQLYLAFFAFPVTAEVATRCGITAVLVCFVLSSISMGVPSNGGIGPWQWAIMFGLSLYAGKVAGLTTDYSATFANLVLGCQTLLLILLGLFTFICIMIDKKRTRKQNPTTNGNT